MASTDLITFAAGVLGVEPVRLPIVGRGEGWLAVAKPPGIAVGGEVLEASSPDLGAAMGSALAADKPQLRQLGITHAGRVHGLDAAASGVVIFALSPAHEARMRNVIGSRQWEFVFDLLTQTGNHAEGTTITCDLPLTRHALEPRVLVSHSTGKRCETVFTPVRALGRWMLWEARTRENRPHQVRVHAAERGLRIPGESTYGNVPRIYLSDLKPRYRPGRDDERPLHPTLGLHLREIVLALDGGSVTRVTAPRPKSFEVLLRRLQEAAAVGPRELRL